MPKPNLFRKTTKLSPKYKEELIMNTVEILKQYIKEELMNGAGGDLDVNENLLASGIIDSLGVLRLVSFVEERFNIEVPDEDVTLDNFQSIQAITDYLTQLQSA